MPCFQKWLRKDYSQPPELPPVPRKLQPRAAVTHDHFEQLWAIDRALCNNDVVVRISTRPTENSRRTDRYRTFGTYVPDGPDKSDVGQTELSEDGIQFTSRRKMDQTRLAMESAEEQRPVIKDTRPVVIGPPVYMYGYMAIHDEFYMFHTDHY